MALGEAVQILIRLFFQMKAEIIICRFTHNQSLKRSTTGRYLRRSEMSNITKRKVKATQYTTKFSIHIFMLLCQQNAAFILGPELAKSLTMC